MRYGIVLGTNERSKLLYAVMESVIRTSLGDEVSLFLTMEGVKAFTKSPEVVETNTSSKLAKESGEDYMELIRKAKKTGRINVYACSLASKMFHYDRNSYQDVVDDIVGITSFLMGVDGYVTSVW